MPSYTATASQLGVGAVCGQFPESLVPILSMGVKHNNPGNSSIANTTRLLSCYGGVSKKVENPLLYKKKFLTLILSQVALDVSQPPEVSLICDQALATTLRFDR